MTPIVNARLVKRGFVFSFVVAGFAVGVPFFVAEAASHATRDSVFRIVDATSAGNWVLHRHPRLSKRIFGRTAAADGAPARDARFNDPSGILMAPDGRLFVSDRRDHRIRVIEDGKIETLVGDGKGGYSGEDVPRKEALVSFPEGLAMDMAGNLFFADAHNHRIRVISPDGIVRTVAGGGAPGYEGDGGAAVEASLNRPSDVCVKDDGTIVIADVDNHAIRQVRRDGTITTVAGTGEPGFTGDGKAAEKSRLNKPWGVACTADGLILIADSRNHRIRKVTRDGSLVTIAGSGRPGYDGDGGPAIEARFDSPQEIVPDGRSGLFVVDEHNHSIRYIDRAGYVHTVAGTGEPGETDEGASAAGGRLNDPEDVWVLGPDRILIADGDNRRIRMVDSEGLAWRVAGK